MIIINSWPFFLFCSINSLFHFPACGAISHGEHKGWRSGYGCYTQPAVHRFVHWTPFILLVIIYRCSRAMKLSLNLVVGSILTCGPGLHWHDKMVTTSMTHNKWLNCWKKNNPSYLGTCDDVCCSARLFFHW